MKTTGSPLAAAEVPPLVETQAAWMRAIFGGPGHTTGKFPHVFLPEELPPNPRIAIIDDQDFTIKALRRHLKLAGYKQFATTTDSTRALDLICESEPDVVLLDVVMPRVTGLEILKIIRQRPESRRLPVIVLTAADEASTKLAALRLGATDFLTKPVDPVELVARLPNVLAAKAYEDRIRAHAARLEREVAIRSAELAQAYREVVACLANVGEHRDSETGNHVLRVGRYAEIMARRLGLSDEVVQIISQAAALHDIGKVGIPDSILLKAGQLEAEEMEQMRGHCEYGADICALVNRPSGGKSPSLPSADTMIARSVASPVLALAAVIALTHHERWDGTGYPRGLASEQIPVEGRIVCVADVFDALTNRRPYKPAFSLEKSLGIMREQRGTYFDPKVFDTFCEAFDEVVEVYRTLTDTPASEPLPLAAP